MTTKVAAHKQNSPAPSPTMPGVSSRRSGVQLSARISSPHDPAEREAEDTAKQIMRMAGPGIGAADRTGNSGAAAAARIDRKAAGSDAGPAVTAGIDSSMSGGSPLPSGVRSFMEPRFGADFGSVRIHTGDASASLNRQVNAHAFTTGNHIFFGKDKFQPGNSEGKELIAHELTHTVQQGAAIQRSAAPAIAHHLPVMVQRLGISDALDYIADKANYIPGFRMFTIILGVNPVNMKKVERSAANIMRAVVEFMPGGKLITQALEQYGVFEKAGNWVEQQLRTLAMTGSAIKDALMKFLDSLGWRDIFRLGDVWERAKRIFSEPIDRIKNFLGGLVSGIIGFIKQAILMPLARLAEKTKGYDLLKAVLGKDPVTGEPYPTTPDTLIGGFMKLIGQEEVWQNLKKANAVNRAMAWFKGALTSLLGFVRQIPSLFLKALQSLELMDIVVLPNAFIKVAGVFGSFFKNFFDWAGKAVWNLLEIIFEVVAPGAMPYLRKAAASFKTILKDPIRFVGNLVRAGKLGFEQFSKNIVKHLKKGIIEWLTGAMSGAGLYIPQSLEFREILMFLLSALGLTWQNIRVKLVRVVGETAVKAMETGFDIVVTLVTKGPAAAWEKIKEELGNLKDIVMEEIMSFVKTKIVESAITKLLMMLNPAGAFIQAIIAIYNTVMFFIERIRQIIQVAMSFIDSISAIAAGAVASAANRVEQTMAGLLTLVISFLARFAGLGKVSDAVTKVLNRIRGPIDKALDKIVTWIVEKGKALFAKGKAAVGQLVEWWKQKKPFRTKGGEDHYIFYTGQEKNAVPMVASKDPKPIERKLQEFAGLANGPDATETYKKALPIINQTLTLVKQDANNAAIVSNMQQLFEIFDEHGPVKETKYVQQGRTLPGDSDSTEVGTSMSIDWLSAAFIESHPGSPPGSGQDVLMKKLVVNPKKGSAFKYIRGHLLNENLGGKGENKNLFPITANANSQHLRSTEKEIKEWIVPKQKIQQNRYALYEVKVDVRSVRLKKEKIEENLVNSTFNCRVVLKDESGKEKKSFLTAIKSEYEHKETAEKFDLADRK